VVLTYCGLYSLSSYVQLNTDMTSTDHKHDNPDGSSILQFLYCHNIYCLSETDNDLKGDGRGRGDLLSYTPPLP